MRKFTWDSYKEGLKKARRLGSIGAFRMHYHLLNNYRYNYHELVTKINILTLITTLEYRYLNYSHSINEKTWTSRERVSKLFAHPHPARERDRS